MSTYHLRTNIERLVPAPAGPAAAGGLSRSFEPRLADSTLDRSIPLGLPFAIRPQRGPSAVDYYKRKHQRGEFGRYWPLHKVSFGR